MPPFSGGLLDAWPGWAVDAFGILREETTALVRYHQMHKAVKAAVHEEARNG